MRAPLLALGILAAGIASAEPHVIVREGARHAALSGVHLSLDAGRIDARLEFPGGGRLRAHGSIAGGDLDLDVEAVALPPATLPFLLRTGPTPRSRGGVDGQARVSGRLDRRVFIDLDARLAEGWLDWIDIHFSAPIQIAGKLELLGPTLLDAQITAGAATTPALDAAQLRGHVRYEKKILRIEGLTGKAFDADWNANFEMDFGQSPRQFSVFAAAESEPDGVLFDLGSRESSSLVGHFDSVDGRVQVRGLWTGDLNDTLTGDGRLRIRGGSLRGTPILPAVWNALIGNLPLGQAAPLADLMESETQMVEASLTFRVGEGALHSQDIQAETGDYIGKGEGWLKFDASLDVSGSVSLTPAGIQRMFTMSMLPVPKASVGLGWIPMRITGTLDEPNATANVHRVPLRLIRGLFSYVPSP